MRVGVAPSCVACVWLLRAVPELAKMTNRHRMPATATAQVYLLPEGHLGQAARLLLLLLGPALLRTMVLLSSTQPLRSFAGEPGAPWGAAPLSHSLLLDYWLAQAVLPSAGWGRSSG